ncbi:uncharacterized protein LOC131613606 [Vicia villosa]|uniref:uncharacterized protein LOC131613606 n=1 Tax=Vicia villosa TaxID=3911 RepID=UPI00273AD9FC|nr:uncharacterized protein LOC131613606 [Vicia villosa]
MLIREEEWSKNVEELALGNSKALNALFNGIDKNIFRLVQHCDLAKDVWDILKTTHEGTSKVKMSRLQMLTTKFENLRMKEDETIHDFYMNILEIANASGALGEKMSEENLVRKILRSLPKRFAMKVTSIEESQDISKMKVDELIGSLQTFEMSICDNGEKKNKSKTFVSNTDEDSKESYGGSNENLSEAIAMLGRQFNNKSYDSSRRYKFEEKTNQGKWIQYHGCEGYGHIRTECPTFLKEQKKGLSVTWSNGDFESESQEETAKHITVLTSVCASDDDSNEDELTFDELAASYKDLCVRSAEVGQRSGDTPGIEFGGKSYVILRSNPEACMSNQILFGYPNNTHQAKRKQVTPVKYQQCVVKSVALLAHISLKVSAKED